MRSLVQLAVAAEILVAGFGIGESRGQHLATDSDPIASSSPVIAPAAGVFRSIDDPHFGTRWLLVADREHPGGPGRLIPAESAPPSKQSFQRPRESPRSTQVIHAGDPILLEEHSRTVDACLEAIALDPAPPGGRLRVRLKLGGRVVRATASGPGHADLAPKSEARP